MKKRVWTLVVAALLLVSLLAVGAFATEETEEVTFAPYTDAEGVRQYCACGNKFVTDANGTVAYVNGEDGCKNVKDAAGNVTAGCDGTILDWKPMASGSITLGNWGTPGTTGVGGTGSNFYLTGDVKNTSTNIGNANNGTYHFDLNGYTIYKDDSRVLIPKQGGKLFFTDTSAAKTGKIESRYTDGTSNQGAVVWFQNTNAAVTLFGGTVDGSTVTTTSGSGGATVYIGTTGSVLNVFGGEIIGGTASAGNGGAICVNATSGTANIYGGTVTGGTAVNGGAICNKGTLNIGGNAIITGGVATGKGGGIYNEGTATMTGGEILRGENGSGAALIYQKGEDAGFTVTDGTIDATANADTDAQHGALTVTGNSILTINGGTVKGNPKSIYTYSSTLNIDSGTVGGNQLYINGTDSAPSTVNVTGGTVETEIYLVKGSATISGAPVLKKAMNFKDTDQQVTIGNLSEGASIPVNVTNYPDAIIPSYTLTDTDALQYLSDSDAVRDLYWIEGEGLYCGKYNCAVCGGVYAGCDHAEKVKYTPWEGKTLPNESGCYYLVESFAVSNQGTVDADATVVLDLNGQSVTRTTRITRIANSGATLTITDTGVGGSISSTWSASDNGAIAVVTEDTTLNLYAGTLDASGVTNSTYGSAVTATGAFNMYGGKVIGGATVKNSSNANYGYGGAVSVGGNGTFTMLGGEVIGGVAQYGGAIGVKNGAAASITGGKIISGAGTNGTAIYVGVGATLSLKDATVQGGASGTTIWNRGVITLAGKVDMPEANFDIMIDCRGGDSYLDVKELTEVTDLISVRRWEKDSVNDDIGVLAVNATEAQSAMFEAKNSAYYDIVCADNQLLLNMPYNFYGMNGSGEYLGAFDDLADLSAASADITYYQANKAAEEVTIGSNITLDLNGKDLSNATVNEGVTLMLIDSANDGYHADACGSLSGTVGGTVNTFADFAGKTYLVVNENDVYSAHRYEVKLTHVSLDPTNDALGYKAQFNGDETVRKNVTGYGFNLWVDGGNVKTYTKEEGFENGQVLTLRLKNVLAANGGETVINANAFVAFGEDTVTGTEHGTTMKQTLQAVNAAWDTYTETQQAAVKALCDKFAVTQTWELTSIYPEETV